MAGREDDVAVMQHEIDRLSALLEQRQAEVTALRQSLQETAEGFESLTVSTRTRLDVAAAEMASMEKQIAQNRVILLKKGCPEEKEKKEKK